MALFDRSSTLASMLNNSQRGNGCVPYDPNARAPTYDYDPSLYVSSGFMFPLLMLGSNLRPLVGHTLCTWTPKLTLSLNKHTDAEIIIQRCRDRLHRRLLCLNAGAHCASDYEPQMVVLRPRTGCFWYATLAKPEKHSSA